MRSQALRARSVRVSEDWQAAGRVLGAAQALPVAHGVHRE